MATKKTNVAVETKSVKTVKEGTKMTKKETEKKVEVKAPAKAKKNAEAVNITIMDNDTLRKLFIENGCEAKSRAKNESKVVYQQFGTKSRVLQQGKAYQLLLTNGHANNNGTIVDTDNDDTARFLKFVGTLKAEEKTHIIGADTIMSGKLSHSEMPRERTAKINSYDVLVKFIQYMATFEENKVVVAE